LLLCNIKQEHIADNTLDQPNVSSRPRASAENQQVDDGRGFIDWTFLDDVLLHDNALECEAQSIIRSSSRSGETERSASREGDVSKITSFLHNVSFEN